MAQHRGNPCPEFARKKGFGDVVVGAGFQTHEGIQFLSAGGQHDNVSVGQQAQLADHFKAVNIRQAQIQRDRCGVVRPDRFHPFSPIGAGKP